MKNFLKIAEGVDIMPLLAAIKRNPQLWKEDTYLRDYPQGPFGDTETIMLRFPVKGVYETQQEAANHLLTHDPHENIDYPPYKLLAEARPLVMALMARVQGERLGRVMINKLQPGGRIFPHADTPEHAAYYTRHHLVLESDPGNVFRCEDEQVYMRPGEVWWFNNALEHEVVNNSANDRINIVIDIRTAR
jgi:hypothetical protein